MSDKPDISTPLAYMEWQEQRITELEQENAELKRIIAESQKQKPYAWMWKHESNDGWELYIGESCPTWKDGYETKELFASPVIQEGMQLVGEKSENGIEWQFANTVHDMPVGTKLYAMLNASKEK